MRVSTYRLSTYMRLAIASILVASSATLTSQTAVSAHPDGPLSERGYTACPAGSEVVIESKGIGTITVAWSTTNLFGWKSATYYNYLGYFRYTFTGQRAVYWRVRASTPGGVGGHYGLDPYNMPGGFCDP